jgi:hypothetical protein
MTTSSSEPERFAVLEGGLDIEQREARLVEGADELEESRQRPSIFGHERFLITVAAALMALGVAVILIGWNGAANAVVVEEQIPYVISGGLLGVALATIGALALFSHWLTVSIREARAREAARQEDHDELLGALRSLTEAIVQQEGARDGAARSGRDQRPVRRAPRRS